VTPAEIIYHRRVQVLERAGLTSVTEACATFGVSRTTTYYRWAGCAQRYGLAAPLPKDRRPPVMPTATPPDQVEVVLAQAVARPTIGARRLVDHMAERGIRLSASGVQKILSRHRLGRRSQRLAALAQLTAATTGILTIQPRTARSGSAISPPGPATWSPWTPSMSASQRQRHRAGLAAHRRRHRHPLCGREPGRRRQVGPRYGRLRRPRRRPPGRDRG
jgi:transposase